MSTVRRAAERKRRRSVASEARKVGFKDIIAGILVGQGGGCQAGIAARGHQDQARPTKYCKTW